jgi:coenzyme F420-0:L-glutamate ligase / coenzyme F420-1:gamma-L-glutamate ligase
MQAASPSSATAGLREIVRTRRSIRTFAKTTVPIELIREVLSDALWSPSPHNSQPWRFTVLLTSQDRQHLANAMAERLADELRAEGAEEAAIEVQTHRSQERISAAPVAIVCSLTADGLVRYSDARRSELEWLMAVQSVGGVLQTIFLLAAARELATCWMAAPMYCPEVVCRSLNLPDEYVPQALVLMGYATVAGKMRERRRFDSVVDFRAGTGVEDQPAAHHR